MHISEFDFRYGWVAITIHALETGFTNIREKANTESWIDVIWQLEYAESILGITFVAAQAYILGTVEDVNEIRESNGKRPIDKIDYYSDVLEPLSSGVTRLLQHLNNQIL